MTTQTATPYWFRGYFLNPAKVSTGRRALSIVLGVFLFFALTVFGVIMVLQLSVFNPDYIASYVDNIDISASATNWLNENVAPDRPVAARAAQLGITYFEPQIQEQLHALVRNVYAFFLNRMEQGKLLETVAAQRPLVNDVAANIQSVLNVPGLQSLLNNLGIDPNQIANRINIDQINSYFDMLEKAAKFQTLIVFAKNFFIPLILILIALLIGIIFAAKKLRFIFIVLGLTFAVYGILQLSSLLPFGNFARDAITNLNLNSLANDSAQRFINDVIRMLNIFSGVILFCGIVLVAAYFLTRPRKIAV